MMQPLSTLERAHFEMLEMSLLGLRRQVGSVLAAGLEDNRERLERKIGEALALIILMDKHGEVSYETCIAHAKTFSETLKVR